MENIPNKIYETHIWDLDLHSFEPSSVIKVLKLIEKEDIKKLKELVSGNTYKKLSIHYINTLLKSLAEYGIYEMIRNRDGIKFPHGLGNLCTLMFKKSKFKKYEDFELSKEYDQKIFRKSPETDELYPKTYHNSLSGNTKNYKFREFWLFKQSHFLRDIINKETKENPYKYLRVENVKEFSKNMKFLTKLKKDANR